ncbi:hypothetical protein BD410DRAFT_119557 [Rickenella mellea]|uniref:Uncharacterized protein n=1 Tax=Rickenella mellea TaxID=50990 RepID=A0A4Y7QC10_9AGAM|nr:hypothetical protein BD410DRAFT_119557 [Rickenella mellea]
MVDHSFFSLNVSHVCRRFRNVALRTPHLWTRLDGNVNLSSTYLSRSGNLDLEIFFPYSSSSWRDVGMYFNIFKVHSDRWSHLRLDYPPYDLFPRLETLASLPRLRFLECLSATSEVGPIDMPSLVHFKGSTARPPQSPLVTCELNLHMTFDSAKLVSTLYELKNLRHLSISFDKLSTQSRIEDVPIYQPKAPLQSLCLSSKDPTPSRFIPRICAILPFHPIAKFIVTVTRNCLNDLWMNDDGGTIRRPDMGPSYYRTMDIICTPPSVAPQKLRRAL